MLDFAIKALMKVKIIPRPLDVDLVTQPPTRLYSTSIPFHYKNATSLKEAKNYSYYFKAKAPPWCPIGANPRTSRVPSVASRSHLGCLFQLELFITLEFTSKLFRTKTEHYTL